MIAFRLHGLPRTALILGVIAFCVSVGFGVVVPVLPVYVRSFGVDNVAVGAVVSAFAVLRLATAPLCGRLGAWLGERAVLAIGIWIVAVSSALTGVAQSYAQLLIFRAAGGIGSAMFTVSAMTLLLGSVAATQRGQAAGFYQTGFLVGGMAGPAVGGLLAQISLQAPFFCYAITLVVAGTVGLLFLPRGAAAAAPAPRAVRPLREVITDRRYGNALLANFAQGWSSFGVRSALVPVLVVEVLHHSPTWTGAAFAIAAVAQVITLPMAGRVVDGIGRRPAIITGSLISGLMITAVPFAPSLPVLIVILAGYSVGSAFLGTAPAALVGDAAGGRAGTPIAIFSMVGDLGAILGPLAAGLVADQVGYPPAFAIGGVLLLVSAAAGFVLPPGVPPEPGEESARENGRDGISDTDR